MAEIKTLVDLFETSCQNRGNAPLFGVRAGTAFSWTTYEQVHARVVRMRTLLRELGVVRGDRVALIADNSIDWAAICYAAAECAAVTVPMYTAQRPVDWEYILRDCRAKVAFLGTARIAHAFGSIRENVPSVQHCLVLEDAGDNVQSLNRHLSALGGIAEIERPQPDDTASFIYTSGTTGQPKGVMLSHWNIVSNVIAGASTFPLYSSDRSLSFLPWAHSFGQTVDLHLLLHVGCQIGLNGDVASLLTNLGLVKPTILIAVPRIFHRIYDGVQKQVTERPLAVQKLFERGVAAATRKTHGQALSWVERIAYTLADRLVFSKVRQRFGGQLRFVISGSAALNRDVAGFVNSLGIEVFEGYGLTEASPVVSVNTPGHRRFGTVGRAIPGVMITIDRSVTQDPENGEIIVAGPNVMQGYYAAPEDTCNVLMTDGRLRTGDLGHLDVDGYLTITGRLKEQYKLANGKYVAPSPIEEQLRLSPLILNCVLFGADRPYCVLVVVPDRVRVEAETRARGLEPGALDNDPNIYEILRQDLFARVRGFQSYMRPKKLLIVTEDFTVDNGLLTPSLKVRRQEIINKYQHSLEMLYINGNGD